MTANIASIRYIEIGRGAGDRPEIMKSAVQSLTPHDDAWRMVKAAVSGGRFPESNETVADNGPDVLLAVPQGWHVFVIRLISNYSDGNARFGPGMSPITLIGADKTSHSNFIQNVHLIAKLADGTLWDMPGESVPEDFGEMPADSWLVFECRNTSTVTVSSAAIMNHDRQFLLPFYLNLYDDRYQVPIWLIGERHSAVEELLTHGGYHPPDKMFYLVVKQGHSAVADQLG
jgi:hypothetical protein